jgi:hypothetical protein
MLVAGTLAVRLDGVFEYNAACCSMQPEFSGVSSFFLVSYNLGLS